MSIQDSFKLILFSSLLFLSSHVLAGEQDSKLGGVFLEFPQGRFQENAAPSFFKWNMQRRTASIALKVFRCDGSCDGPSNRELVARFDFLPDVQSMNWFGEALRVGSYIWTVEAFDKSNPKPVFSDTASFTIEASKSYGFKTDRIGLLAGFGRGTYGSSDDNYDVEFSTTPAMYGLVYGGGSKSTVWNAQGYFSDFILQGDLYKTKTLFADFLWQLNESKPKRPTLFLGPSLRYFDYPQIISTNGIDLQIENQWILSPGLSLRGQYDIDKYVAAQMGVTYDVAVAGAESLDVEVKNGSLNASLGLTYGKLWPVGIGSEIQFQLDHISIQREAGSSVAIRQDQWVFLLHLFYAL